MQRTIAASNVAAAVFLAGALSDGLDGYLARRWGATTRTGQWLDPLADKALVSAPIITLVALRRFPLWAAAVIVAREVGIAVLRAVQGVRGHEMPATPLAKVKTFLQLLAITLYIVPLSAAADPFRVALLIAAVAFTVYTGFDYLAHAFGWLRPPAGADGDG